MCIFRFVPKFNIFNIYAKFQYLYKSSIFMQNLQYLYICVLFSLSGLCTSGFIQLQESERGIIVPVLSYLCQNLQFYVFVHILVFFSFLSVLCTSRFVLASGVREREYHHLYLHRGKISYFCTLFKSFINW